MAGIIDKTKEAIHNAVDSTKDALHHAGEKISGEKSTECVNAHERHELKEECKQALAESGEPMSDLGCKVEITKIEKA
uniref:Uncharacterized protein n=1 Tax=Plectus sambesii TaxID=2011161 RepID=A0A914VK62_9BILA